MILGNRWVGDPDVIRADLKVLSDGPLVAGERPFLDGVDGRTKKPSLEENFIFSLMIKTKMKWNVS